MVGTFFGHRDTPDQVRPRLRAVLLDLIERRGVTQFYVGTHGNFDAMARELLAELERSHGIRYTVVLSALPKKTNPLCGSDHTILPEGIETVLPRFAILYRNKWMIERSDFVVTYVNRAFGGAAQGKALAEKKKKTVIELAK